MGVIAQPTHPQKPAALRDERQMSGRILAHSAAPHARRDARRGPKFRFISFKKVSFYVAPKLRIEFLETLAGAKAKGQEGVVRRGRGDAVAGPGSGGDAAESLDTHERWKIVVKKSE